MNKIASFTVNHLDLLTGAYVSRKDYQGDVVFFGRHSAGGGGLVVFSAVFPAPASDVCQCARRAARHFDRGFPAGVRADAEKPAGAHPVVL